MSSATATIIGLLLLGMALLVAGVYVLAGFGWALLAAGLVCFFSASVVRLGIIAAAKGADATR